MLRAHFEVKGIIWQLRKKKLRDRRREANICSHRSLSCVRWISNDSRKTVYYDISDNRHSIKD